MPVLRSFRWFAFGLVVFVCFCEALLHLLPVPTATLTDYYVDPLILGYPPRHSWTVATGWDLRNVQYLRSNNVGFVAKRDFTRNPEAVGLVGDSFVEASMLRAGDRPDAQLENAVRGRPVFALGGPGSALLDYAERIRWAHEHLGIRDFVVLMERTDAQQSLCDSGNVHGPCLDPKSLESRTHKRPTAGALKRMFRESAIAQYFFGQLRLSPERVWKQALAQSRQLSPHAEGDQVVMRVPLGTPSSIDAVANAFFSRVKPHVEGRLVIVIDSDRHALRRGQNATDSSRERFIALAREFGADVVDTAPLFAAHWRRSSLRLDVGPYDEHLNALGVQLAMEAAAGYLAEAVQR